MYLAKMYGPDSYGIYKVFTSYVFILPVLGSLQLDSIMVMQKGSKEIRNLFSGILLVSFTLIASIVLVLCVLKSLNWVKIELPFYVLVLCGVGGVLTAWNLTQNSMFTKYKLFKQISTALIVAAVFSVVFQGIFYYLGWLNYGLIYGWLIGLVASFVYNAKVSKGRLKKIDIPLFKKNVKENFNIVKFSYTSSAINSIANNLMPILILGYFSALEVGVYGLAFTILSTPLVMLSGSVSRVYFQKAVTLFHHDKLSLKQLTYRVSFSSFLVILVFVLLLNTVGIYVLEIIYQGHEWIGLRTYILILSLWILARSGINPIASIMVVIDKNEYSLIFNIYLVLVNLIAIYLGVINENFLYCLCFFSVFSSVGYFVQYFMILSDLNKISKS